MKILADDLWICPDCLFYVANGQLPDDPADAERVLEGARREEPAVWVLDGPHVGEHAPECWTCDGEGADAFGDPCELCRGTGRQEEEEGADAIEFSWSACDCCGSGLGGSRHRAALIGEDPAAEADSIR